MQAEIIKSKLEAHGIFAHVSADDVSGYRQSFTMLHAVNIMVHEKDFALAEEILADEE